MRSVIFIFKWLMFLLIFTNSLFTYADENLFGYLKGAETLPKESWEMYQFLTSRTDKGVGTYKALDSKTEIEYGVTDRFTSGVSFKMQSIESKDILLDAYIPKDINSGFQFSGVEASFKYNFLSPAKDDIGFSTYFSISRGWLDSHSGQKKDTTSTELEFLLQKYFLEGELILVGNFGLESTYAERYQIDGLPSGFEWPTHPEMEIGFKVGTGITYRFIPKWFFGGEVLYESEYETEVGQERFSTFAGPTIHYGSEKWWSTVTYFQQLAGGGPPYAGQENTNLHLIEKTKQEIRLKLGYNF
ncbi:MAG: DUF6662 family protein [Pseudobdellovibrio sp.]